MTDRELLELLRNDDSSGLRDVFLQLHKPLCKLAFQIVKDSDQSKDIVQDVWVNLWRMRHNLNIKGSLTSYLRKAVVNTALNYISRQRRTDIGALENTSSSRFAGNPTDDQLSYDELKQMAERAIEALPVRTRAVFSLIRSQEMSYKEVAESLQISIKAVEKEMMKALALLRVALRDYLPVVLMIGYMQGS